MFRMKIACAVGGMVSAVALAATPASARTLDPSKPADAVEISKRTQCGPADNTPGVYRWTGRVYSRRAGERDQHLFNVEGMNIRQCASVTDAKRGTGYRLVSREIMLYLDPKTNQVLRNWTNPFTGKTVEVMHVGNDPVNSRPTFPYGEDGQPYSMNMNRINDTVFLAFEAPLFYTNPLAGDYQDYVGNKYHAMEIFDFAMSAKDALDTSTPTAYPSVAWVRISDWMPWMMMEGREGQMVFNAVGTKLKSFDQLPQVMKDEIAANYPAYVAPPPVDDARPNETTWTVFKKQVDAKRAGEAAPAKGK